MRKRQTRVAAMLTALVSAVGSAVAFSGDLAGDTRALDEFHALSKKFDEAIDRRDAAAVAALFTEDGVFMTPTGVLFGRRAIEESCARDLKLRPVSSHIHQADQLCSVGKEAWSLGQWWSTVPSERGPAFLQGYWSALFAREGDAWKFRMLTFNETSAFQSPAGN